MPGSSLSSGPLGSAEQRRAEMLSRLQARAARSSAAAAGATSPMTDSVVSVEPEPDRSATGGGTWSGECLSAFVVLPAGGVSALQGEPVFFVEEGRSDLGRLGLGSSGGTDRFGGGSLKSAHGQLGSKNELKIGAVLAPEDGAAVGGVYGPSAAASAPKIVVVLASRDGAAARGVYGPSAEALAQKIVVLASRDGGAVGGVYGPSAAALAPKIVVLASRDGEAARGAYDPAAAAEYYKIVVVLASGDGAVVGGAYGPAAAAAYKTVGSAFSPADVESGGTSGAAAGGTFGPSVSVTRAWGPAPAAPGPSALALVRSDSVIYNVHENATSNSDECALAVGIGVADAWCGQIPAPPALITSGRDVLSPTRGAEVGRSHVKTTKVFATSGDGDDGSQGTATTTRPFTTSISDWDGRRVWPWQGESGGGPRPTASTRGAEWSLMTRSHAGAQDGARWARGARVPRFILNYVPSVSPATYLPPLPSTIERVEITCYSDSTSAVYALNRLEMGWPDDEDYLFTRRVMGLPYAAGLFEADASDTGTEADSVDSYGSVPDLIPPEEQDSDSSSLSTGASAYHRRRLSPTCVGEIDGRKRALADFSATPEYSGMFPRPQPIVVWASDALARPDALSRQGADGSESSDDSLGSAGAEPPVGAAGAAAPAEGAANAAGLRGAASVASTSSPGSISNIPGEGLVRSCVARRAWRELERSPHGSMIIHARRQGQGSPSSLSLPPRDSTSSTDQSDSSQSQAESSGRRVGAVREEGSPAGVHPPPPNAGGHPPAEGVAASFYGGGRANFAAREQARSVGELLPAVDAEVRHAGNDVLADCLADPLVALRGPHRDGDGDVGAQDIDDAASVAREPGGYASAQDSGLGAPERDDTASEGQESDGDARAQDGAAASDSEDDDDEWDDDDVPGNPSDSPSSSARGPRYYSDGSDEEDSDERWRDEIVDSDA